MGEFYMLGWKAYISSKWNVIQMTNDIVLWVNVWWRITSILSMPGKDKLLQTGKNFYNLRYTVFMITWESYFMMGNGFLMWIMLFKHMTFSRQLRFIFDLFDKTAGDLAYFALVFGVFLIAFSMSAFIIFGTNRGSTLLRCMGIRHDHDPGER